MEELGKMIEFIFDEASVFIKDSQPKKNTIIFLTQTLSLAALLTVLNTVFFPVSLMCTYIIVNRAFIFYHARANGQSRAPVPTK